MREADTLKCKTKEYEGLFTGKLRISSASTGKYVIPCFLSPFVKKHNGIDYILDDSNKIMAMKSLKDNEIDFALVSVVLDEFDVYEESLIENRLYLVGNTKKYSKDLPLIFREDGSATRSVMDRYFQLGKQRKRIELTSNEAVIAGLGYSLIPLIGMKNELQNQEVHIIPSKNLPITTNWRLIWMKNKKLSPVAKEFLNYVQGQKNQIVDAHFNWYLDFIS